MLNDSSRLPVTVQGTYDVYFESWLTYAKIRTVQKDGKHIKVFVIIIPQDISDFMDLHKRERIQVAIRRWPQKPVLYYGDRCIVSSKLRPQVGVTTSNQAKPASVLHKCGTSHALPSRGTTALTRRSGSRIGRMCKFPSQANIPHAMNGNPPGEQAKSKAKDIPFQLVFPGMCDTLGDLGTGGSPHHPRQPSPPPMNSISILFICKHPGDMDPLVLSGTRSPTFSTVDPQSDIQGVSS